MPFVGTYSSWQTGGVGAGTINPSASSQFGVWPPPTLAGITPNEVTLLPMYTNTASVETLPMPTHIITTGGATSTISAGDGWLDTLDTQGGVTAMTGCTYPDPWNAVSGVALPTAACTGLPAAVPLITPPPPART